MVVSGGRGTNDELVPGADAYDPHNRAIVYLRFQRGVLAYDASCACTRDVLFGDYFKAILTGQNLPADLAQEAQGSRWFRAYDPSRPLWVRNPDALEDTDTTYAFTPG